MEKTKLSPPWITYVREITKLFEQDKDVKIFFDDDTNELTFYVYKYDKAAALSKILPKQKTFGNITVNISITYKGHEKTAQQLYEAAFENNPAFKYAYTFETSTNPITYVVFKKEVVQYWNDDMSDPHGITSTLFENIARDTLRSDSGTIFSTDSEEADKWRKCYYKHHATQDEIKEWERYNGKGSFSNGSKLSDTLIDKENLDEKVKQAKDSKAFKSVFRK